MEGYRVNMENKIIGVLIGLAGACGNNPKTENTDRLVIKSLAFTKTHPDYDDTAIETIIEEIHAEKNKIAPGCAQCASPCGNTSDFDMNRIDNFEEGIRRIKLQILSELCEIAAHAVLQPDALSEPETLLLYKALLYISYDLEEETLQTLLDELGELKSFFN